MFHTYYKQYGNKIFFRYKNKDSRTISTVVKDYKPKLYIHTKDESDFKSIFNKNLKSVEFDSIREAKDFADKYKDVDNFEVEGNSDFANQFVIELMKGETAPYKAEDIRYCVIDIEVDSGEDGEFPEPEEYKHPITFSANYDSLTDTYTLFGLKNSPHADWCRSKAIKDIPDDLKIEYNGFDTEEDLLRAMMQYFAERQFDFTSGWNSEEFDMPYLVLRSMHILSEAYVEKMMSPFNKIDIRNGYNNFGNPIIKVDICGVPHLDYMKVYKKHTYKTRASYKLDHVAEVELGKKKVEYDGSLHDLYTNQYQLYGDYNLVDTYLIVEMERKLKLFHLIYAMSYFTLSNFTDAMGTVKIWENLVAKYLYTQNKAPLYYLKKQIRKDFGGGFVSEPRIGFVDWCVSYDLTSLYPSCEMQYNIGYETRIPDSELPEELKQLREKYTFDDILNETADLSVLKKHNVAMTPNFQFYRKDQVSFFSAIKRDLFNNRKIEKNKMLDAEAKAIAASSEEEKSKYERLETQFNNMQLGLKVLNNGGYGAVSNVNFRYYQLENAEAITTSGQMINKYFTKKTNEFLSRIFKKDTRYVIYNDTDSGYVDMSVFAGMLNEDDAHKKVEKIDEFSKTVVEPEIDLMTKSLADYLNVYENRMKFNREIIAESAVFCQKKRYFAKVWNSEGVVYKDPYIKIQGLEPVKSSYPQWARDYLKESCRLILNRDESKIHDYVEKAKSDFLSMDIEQIAVPRGVRGIEKYTDKETMSYIKGTPNHTKGAIIHNRICDQKDLKHIQKIKDGDKIKFIALKKPNMINEEVIAFDGKLPEEFNLDKYVDRDSIFEVTFMSPLRSMLDSVGWHEEELETLF